jgi:uncharacterized protein (DUF1330 family)
MNMSAFFIATATINNPEKVQEYARKAAETFAAHGGEFVVRGKLDAAFVGSADHQVVAVVRFPSMGALNAWYKSPEYQAIIPLRTEAADMKIVTYSVMA